MNEDVQREEIRRMLNAIAERKSFYFVMKVLQLKNVVQVTRMIETGRCQHWQFVEIERIYGDVSRETLQNVTSNETCISRQHEPVTPD